jgi:hypothetical protein
VAGTFETQGTKILRGDGGSPEVFTEIPLVKSIDPVGFSRSLIDTTHLASTAREYRMALKDGQEIDVECFYDPKDATHAGLRDDLNNGTRRNFKIVLTDTPPTEISFTALVMNWSLGAPIDNVYPLKFKLKPTGDLVWS